MELTGADRDSNRRSFLMWARPDLKIIQGSPQQEKKDDLFYTKAHLCTLRNEWRTKDLSEQGKQHKACHTTLWSGHSAHKRKPGNPPLSLLALFPIDLYSLIKTNQGGILHVDSIWHSGELSHLIWMAGSPSPLSVACSKGLTNLIVLRLAWLRKGV